MHPVLLHDGITKGTPKVFVENCVLPNTKIHYVGKEMLCQGRSVFSREERTFPENLPPTLDKAIEKQLSRVINKNKIVS